ncbi:MAG: phosphate acyltransferase PlsX [Planctomycetes bacterium]|nr:phosphate acyltransferase PlsX [Planctomycetota bacterium]
MRIAIDAMGGDHAPLEIIKGVLEASQILGKEDELTLVGDESVIKKHLSDLEATTSPIQIVHAPETIGMNEKPVESIRKKRKSSIAIMAKMAAKKQADAIISAGNTGACVAAGQLRMRNLAGVNRPGISVILPTFGGPVTICDVGANVSCKPINLYQYAVMSSIFSTEVTGIERPRVGLMGIGVETEKGNDLVKKAREMIESDPNLNFTGFVEGRDIMNAACDVVICEGFVGNIVLKLTEGVVDGLFGAIKKELVIESKELAEKFGPVMKKIYQKYDYHEFGGGLLIGLNGISMICHGSSKSRTIKSAVLACKELVSHKVNDKIVEYLSNSTVRGNGE